MIDLLIATSEQEPSKTLYFVAGGALTLFAIGISVFGFTKPDFPSSAAQSRAVMITGVVLFVFALVSVVVTS